MYKVLMAIIALFILCGLCGNAMAVYNIDGAAQNSSGGWSLPLYCVGVPGSYTGSGNAPAAVKRTDLPATYAGCQQAATSAITAGVNTTYNTQALCNAAGYYWDGYNAPGTQCVALFVTTDSPSGSGWVADENACLRCHSTGQFAAAIAQLYHLPSGAKESYLTGGHKNMLRKVTPGLPWALPGSSIYTLGVNGTTSDYNWLTGQIDAGSCSDKHSAKAACIPPLVWTSNWKTMYWIYGGNGLSGTTPYTATSGSSYSCGRCHATGWTSDATVNTGKEPELSFPGISATINLAGGVSGDTNNYSSWDRWGIQCSRCHVAQDGGHATFPKTTSTGGDKTALCMNCHRQESSGVPDVINGDPLKAGGTAIPTGSPASTLVVGSGHGGPVGFVSHSHGTQFLNSPHARMAGAWNQIGCPPVSISPSMTDPNFTTCDSTMGTYNSDFALYTADWSTGTRTPKRGTTPTGGGCTVCHDVHKTVLENTAGQSDGGVADCTACHFNAADTSAPQINAMAINHPATNGTPLAVSKQGDACVICHMPGGQHVFRISADPNYTEFPAAAAKADMPAPTAPETQWSSSGGPSGAYANAVWVDLDLVCGQCHGGSAGPAATQNGAPYKTKAELAVRAKNIHGIAPNPRFTSSQAGTTVSVSAGSSFCPRGGSCVFSWDFGDGSAIATGATATHTYSSAATHSITLYMFNMNTGSGKSRTKTITVSN